MNGSDDVTPAERRLLEYVEQLRARDLPVREGLTASIVGTARWQALARPYMSAAGVVASAAGTGMQLLLGSPEHRR